MADTRRLQAIKAVRAALEAGGAPEGFAVHGQEFRAITKDKLPCAVVYGGGNGRSTDRGGDRVDNTEPVFVEIRIQGDVETPPDDAIDPYFSWVWQTVMSDPTLGGAVNHTTVDGWERFPAVEKDRVYIGLVLEFHVKYQTLRTNPESSG